MDLNIIGLSYDGIGVLTLWLPSVWKVKSYIKVMSATGYGGFTPQHVHEHVLARLDLTYGSILLFAGFLLQLLAAMGVRIGPSAAWCLWGALAIALTAYFAGARRAVGKKLADGIIQEMRPRAEGS